MRIKDPKNEELRHTLAHLHCTLEVLVDIISDLMIEDERLVEARRHLVAIESAVFTDEELSNEQD